MPSAMQARQWLEELSTAGDEVALILAGQSLSEMTGSELLNEAHHLHPHAKRALLVEWGALGDRATGKAIFDSIAHGRIDHYLLKPSPPPGELFHNTISGLLLEWAEAQRAFPFSIRVVGESWSGRAYELRKALNRCAYPHAFWLALLHRLFASEPQYPPDSSPERLAIIGL
jgi:thioredoxin reductase (NADPH)